MLRELQHRTATVSLGNKNFQLRYNLMEPPSYLLSITNQNIIMWCAIIDIVNDMRQRLQDLWCSSTRQLPWLGSNSKLYHLHSELQLIYPLSSFSSQLLFAGIPGAFPFLCTGQGQVKGFCSLKLILRLAPLIAPSFPGFPSSNCALAPLSSKYCGFLWSHLGIASCLQETGQKCPNLTQGSFCLSQESTSLQVLPPFHNSPVLSNSYGFSCLGEV